MGKFEVHYVAPLGGEGSSLTQVRAVLGGNAREGGGSSDDRRVPLETW